MQKINEDVTNNINSLLEFSKICEKLKQTKRFKHTPLMIEKESVADHSWKVSMLAITIIESLNLHLNIEKALKIALVHDLPEAICDDTDYYLVFSGQVSPEEKEKKELNAAEEVKQVLNNPFGDEIFELWQDYQFGLSREGRFIKAIDKIEGINHMIYRELIDYPDKIAHYADKAVTNFPELKPVPKEVKLRLKKLYENQNVKWKKEYDLV